MAFWPCSSSPRVSDVSAELDDIIKRLASGDPSSDPSFESSVSDSSHPDNNNETDPEKVKCPEKCEAVLVVGENKVESGAENVCGVEEPHRSKRASPQLTPTINTDDVTSREPKSEACLEKACSAGSYARRKHHKHHKHRHRSPSPPPTPPEDLPKSKINPVFVWVRQEECRIVEVMCEDYDRRNRLRLAKTPLGWRAIPKTEVFASAVIPKAPSISKAERRRKRRKSCKKKRRSREDSTSESVIKDCTVSLLRTEINHYINDQQSEDDDDDDSKVRIEKEVEEEMLEYSDTPVSKMTKSSSCEFQARAQHTSMVRSSSLNFSITSSLPEVQNVLEPEQLGIKMEEEVGDKVLDMTKHGDLNDNDCDELGMLLKEIPDLEFVEEQDMDEDDEFEELALPKDLTLPKAKETPRKLPQLPPNISSLVTVTSSPRPPQPLTAPLPEVTITPIPNPMPAHQQKPQNKYLESLLSASRTVKPERNELTITRAKPTKRPYESQDESKAKHVKLEDITLKSLLNKQNYEEKARAKADAKSRLHDLLTTEVDPIAQLKQVLSNPELAVPDPLLVPRARLPALVASPASEIPRLLMEKKIAEPPRPPLTDPDMLVVSLSHLRSLLSYKCNNTEDLSTYQKSLEAFLEWQRYQTELMEAQMKATTPLTPGDIDMATANAFNQMLWLPYLNQLESNRDLMNILNSVCSPYGQSSPFLTPTSPMEGHMKTLAMWQEAMMAQQAPNMKLPSPTPPEPRLKIPTPCNTPRRRGPNQVHFRPSYGQMLRQQAQYECQRKQQQQQQRQLQHQQKHLARQRHEQQQMFQLQQMQQNYNNFHDDISKQLKLDLDRKAKTPAAGIAVKPLQNLLDKREAKKSSSWFQFEEDLKKSAEVTNQMALQWQQFEEEMRKSQIQISRNQKKIKAECSSEQWPTDDPTRKTIETKPEVKDMKPVDNGAPSETQVPKLKVKNLVDPNMSPPKLLKAVPPVHLLAPTPMQEEQAPMAEDPQSHLWHPLFGRYVVCFVLFIYAATWP